MQGTALDPTRLAYLFAVFSGTASSVAGGLVLLRLEPLRGSYALGTALAAGLLGVLFSQLAAPAAAWALLLLACMLAARFLFRAGFCRAGLTALLSGLFLELHLLVCRCLLELDPPLLRLSVCLLLVLSLAEPAAAGLCWRYQAALLPSASQMSVLNDASQRRKLRRGLLYIGASLAMMDLWVLFALSVQTILSGGLRLALALLTLGMSAVLLGYIRRLAFNMVERAEALMDKQYQNELLSFMQVIRSQRHDFNFHMRAISGLIAQKQYQECDEYIGQMLKNTAAMNDILPLRHPAVSAMISAFWELALQKGIDFDADISSDLAQMPCTIYETNTIIGNLLQHGIDELEQSRSRGPLQLLILYRGGSYVIRVTNPCSRGPEELANMFQPGYSTKQSHEGIGLAAVQRIAQRYGGYVFPEFGEGTISVIVQIPLRL